jgi:hypothetical protein
MTRWDDVAAAVPDLAARVEKRFEATGLAFLATRRADGFPRISPLEPGFLIGGVWLGMMPASLKVADLRRDGRLALHAASIDKQVKEGDAKISGLAVEADDATFDRVRTALADRTGNDPSAAFGRYPLFEVDITDVSFLIPNGNRLAIEWWTPSGGYKRVDRG